MVRFLCRSRLDLPSTVNGLLALNSSQFYHFFEGAPASTKLGSGGVVCQHCGSVLYTKVSSRNHTTVLSKDVRPFRNTLLSSSPSRRTLLLGVSSLPRTFSTSSGAGPDKKPDALTVVSSKKLEIGDILARYKDNSNARAIIMHLCEASGFTIGPNFKDVIDLVGDEKDDDIRFINDTALRLNVCIQGNVIKGVTGPLSRHTGVRRCFKKATKGIFLLRATGLMIPELHDEMTDRIRLVLLKTVDICTVPLVRGDGETDNHAVVINQ